MWYIIKNIALWALKYPALIGMNLIRHDKASTIDSRYDIEYGNHRLQRYDVHTAIKGDGLPTLFYIHGGSWMSLDKKYYNYIVKTIGEAGYKVININYRLLPNFTLSDVVLDCESAIMHALKNIQGINRQKLLIAGDSAGAHLSALIAAKANSGAMGDIKFIGAGIIYGLMDMNDMIYGKAGLFKFLTKYFLKETGSNYKEILNEFSPVKYFNGNFPPAFITSGTRDPLHPATASFIRIMEDKGVKHRALIFSKDRRDGMHGFLSMTWLQSSKDAIKTMLEFFNELC